MPRSASPTTWAARARSGASPCSPTASEGIPMDFGFSEEQEMLRKSARDFLAKESPMTYVRQMMEDERGFRDEQWQQMAGLGWMGLILPEEHGGAGLDFVDLIVVLEEMGRVVLPGPFFSTVVPGGAPGSTGAEGVNLFLVDAKAPGVSTTLLKTMDQTRKLCEVALRDVSVPAERLLGPAGQGWKLLERVTDRGKVGLCAEMCGGAQKVLEMSVDYAKVREQFGRPIGSFQAIQHKCANMLVEVESSKWATYYAAWAVANDVPEGPLAAAMAKAYCSDAYRHTSGEGIQIHGGIGFTWEHDMHIYFKRAKSSEVTFGDATWNREIVAQLIGL